MQIETIKTFRTGQFTKIYSNKYYLLLRISDHSGSLCKGMKGTGRISICPTEKNQASIIITMILSDNLSIAISDLIQISDYLGCDIQNCYIDIISDGEDKQVELFFQNCTKNFNTWALNISLLTNK